MADVLRGRAHDLAVGDLAQLHRVVRHQTVAALDQLNGQLTLADAAVAQDQDSFTIHLHQHTVACDAGCQLQIQHADQTAHQGAGHLVGAEQGHPVLLSQFQHLGKWFQFLTAADDDSRRLLAEQLVQPLVPLLGRKTRKEVHFGQTQDLQPELIKVIIVSGKEQARAVDLRNLDIDLFQPFRGVDHIQTDLFRQLLQRNIEIRHRSSSCTNVSSPCPAAHRVRGTLFLSLIINEMVSDYNDSAGKSSFRSLHPVASSLISIYNRDGASLHRETVIHFTRFLHSLDFRFYIQALYS